MAAEIYGNYHLVRFLNPDNTHTLRSITHSVDWLKKYTRDERVDIIRRAMQVLYSSMQESIEKLGREEILVPIDHMVYEKFDGPTADRHGVKLTFYYYNEISDK